MGAGSRAGVVRTQAFGAGLTVEAAQSGQLGGQADAAHRPLVSIIPSLRAAAPDPVRSALGASPRQRPVTDASCPALSP